MLKRRPGRAGQRWSWLETSGWSRLREDFRLLGQLATENQRRHVNAADILGKKLEEVAVRCGLEDAVGTEVRRDERRVLGMNGGNAGVVADGDDRTLNVRNSEGQREAEGELHDWGFVLKLLCWQVVRGWVEGFGSGVRRKLKRWLGSLRQELACKRPLHHMDRS